MLWGDVRLDMGIDERPAKPKRERMRFSVYIREPTCMKIYI